MRHWLSRRSFLKTLVGSAAAMTAMGVYAFGVEPAFRLRVQRYAPVPPLWPRDLALTATIIADVHVGEPYMPLRRVEEIVYEVAEAQGPLGRERERHSLGGHRPRGSGPMTAA